MPNQTSQVHSGKRQYPGESEAEDIIAYLRLLVRQLKEGGDDVIREEFKEFMKLIAPIIFSRRGESATLPMNDLVEEIVGEVVEHGSPKVSKRGVQFEAVSPRGKATFALLRLVQDGRLDRLRKCDNCRILFYARFKHQRFCNEASKNCQWKYYHSPEWRKRNRERNLQHQRAYRKRLF